MRNMRRSPMTYCVSGKKRLFGFFCHIAHKKLNQLFGQTNTYKIGWRHCIYDYKATFPTLLSQTISFFYTLLVIQNFSLLPGHTTLLYPSRIPWTRVFPVSLLPSRTSNATSSLKLFQSHPVSPLEPYYYIYIISLHEHWLYKTIVLQTVRLKNKQTKENWWMDTKMQNGPKRQAGL